MKLTIYKKNKETPVEISPSDNSTLTHAAMGEHVLALSFTLPKKIPFEVNDYVEFEGNTYTLIETPEPAMKSNQEWNYDLKFYGIEAELKRALVLKTVDKEFNPVFALTGKLSEHLAMIVENVNRIKETTDTWKRGDVTDGENIVMEYNGTSCYDALTQLANQLDTEWWVDGTTIKVGKCERENPAITLGYKKGLVNLNRNDNENVKFFTRLYPIGGTRNIDRNKYGFSRLQLPQVNGKRPTSIDLETAAKFGIIEHFEDTAFAHIYPQRTGTITDVEDKEITNEDGEPFKVYYFKDAGLNFNPNDYEIAGLTKHIVFQEAKELSGYDFEVNYNAETQQFEIINQYDKGLPQLPGNNLIPYIGDKYILYNISMPNTYYKEAEEKFEKAVKEYLEDNTIDKAVYQGETDWIENSKLDIKIGQKVKLSIPAGKDEKGEIVEEIRNSRVTAITKNVNIPSKMILTFSDVIAKGKIESMEQEIEKTMTFAKSNTLPDIVKSWENTEASDYNLFSSLKSVREFLSKNKNDTAKGLITFLKGLKVGDFSPGFLGSGAAITVDKDGTSTAEVDKLIVRRYAKFFELVIERLSHIGGEMIVSPARMICSEMEELDDAYRCYFDTGENDEVVQEFVKDDLARCQVFSGSEMKYYWRWVSGVGRNYIDLSKTEADPGSGVPAAGDHIVQLGHKNNPERQNALLFSSIGEDAPSYKQYSGIDSFSLNGKLQTGFTSKGNRVEGLLNILPGSLGWQNLEGLPEEIAKAAEIEVGAVNLIRNSAFAGDSESRYLKPETRLTPNTEMFSGSLTFWEGEAVVEEDLESASGYTCSTVTKISQDLFRPLIDGEKYVLSFKAKGNITAKIGMATFRQSVTGGYERICFPFEAFRATAVEFSGEFTFCEVQLERGTIATAWSVSPYDNDKSLLQYESLRYMSDAIKGMTQTLGGLVLTSMIQLGSYRNGELEKSTAGISGLYNDDNDVAFWSGGTLEKAIRTAMTFADNPHKQLTDQEWKQLANVVITHGGRAILNDAVFRGTVYADSGIFKGRIEAEEGYFNGLFESSKYGNKISIRHSDNSSYICMDSEHGYEVGKLGFFFEEGSGGGTAQGRIRLMNYATVPKEVAGTLQSSLRLSPQSIDITRYEEDFGSIHFSITYEGQAHIMFKDLPSFNKESDVNLPSGTVYRIGSNLKIVP
ncbi:MAG: hypothetical protein LIO93_10620 [Bacteroidales bacterium]|nr:hypothetical protein [Bacteroidales bacterium]